MRKLIFQAMVSLDGYFEGPGGELDWHDADEEFNDYAVELLNRVDTLVFGRKTYETMAAYWPGKQAAENDPVVSGKMNALKKVVASRTLKHTGWNNTVILNENVAGQIGNMKKQAGKNIALFGSSQLALTLGAHGLIDEYRIFILPVVLGKGRSLFNGAPGRFTLPLADTLTFNSGKVLLVYR